MFNRRIHLFTIFGFPIRLDPSWFIILFLISWTLAMGYFPAQFGPLPAGAYWLMGVIGALGLFVSVIIHEFAHSLVARQYGLPIHGITLFMFGGASELTEEPPKPGAEFLISIVGPLTSFILGALFFGISAFGDVVGWSNIVLGVIAYLALINVVLGVFNLLPAFPLDGGRVLRSALWAWKGNLDWATRVASNIGAGFGVLLALMGVIAILGGSFIGGLWWILIGMFLRGSAKSSYEQMQIQRALGHQPVRQFMTQKFDTLSPSMTLSDFFRSFAPYAREAKTFPIVEEGRLQGCVNLDQLKDVPREEWNEHVVSELVSSCPAEVTVSPDTEATEALSTMRRTGKTKLLVTVNDQLVGILSLKDILGWLSMRSELGERTS